MKVFKLPDLGEGLPDAEIREWYVAEGDQIEEDQPLCSMETAKALVDVPSPFAGVVEKLHGNPGDIIQTGSPLVSFESDGEKAAEKADSGTVVGAIEVSDNVVEESATGIKPSKASGAKIKASMKVRQLAKKLNVDLASVNGTGPGGSITSEDVKLAESGIEKSAAIPEGFEQIHGPRRGMAFAMARSHHEIADVTIMDDADINHFGKGDNITVRLIRAIAAGCKAEPNLNSHFDGKTQSQKLFDEINLAVGVDTPGGLYAPVIRDIANKTDEEIREHIQDFKDRAKSRDFPPEMLHDATFTLSNFGVFVGRYANPMIVPPTVAILGVGKVRHAVVPVNNEPAVHRIIPLSVTIDHRAVTGGEAARFLAAIIDDLQR